MKNPIFIPSVPETDATVDSSCLVKRLRARAKDWASLPSAAIDLTEAADRIEALTAQQSRKTVK